MQALVSNLIDIKPNKGGYPLLLLPANAQKWAAELMEKYRADGCIRMAATNIPDGGCQVVVGFGLGSRSDIEDENPDTFFGFVIDRKVFREMVKSLQLVLEAAESEELPD
jgi:hypothetical protein